MIGTKLGPYEITAKLGEGGMGEVYRAHDTKLKRDVAIKVLPAAFTEDKERLARFEREAQLLAQLHHPNIASIFGLEESGGTRALVMELVEGPTLADRLESGALSLDDSLSFARQIAEALEEAHEKGIVHRDLKPQNIKASREGKIKILDFGLAKAMDPASAAAGATSSASLGQSPTLTIGATVQGLILGTAAYMAPEQAKGFPVDKRADIWAFGVVLFEMLAGGTLFVGDSVSDTLAGVLRNEIDFARLPATTPLAIRELLRRCLERNPKNRLRDIGDARLALDEARAPAAAPPAGAAIAPTRSPLRALPWVIAVAAVALAGWTLVRGDDHARAAAGEVAHLEVSLPAGIEPVVSVSGGIGLSPDGHKLAMVGVRNGLRRVFVRALDRPEVTEIQGSNGVNSVAFSPDGGSIVFVPGDLQVTRLSLADQQRSVVATGADLASTLSWGESGILFQRGGALWIAPARGGEARALTTLDVARHEVSHASAIEIPGSGRIFFSSLAADADASRIETVRPAGGMPEVVLERASNPIWSPTGHLLFERDGALWAVAFDPATARPRGSAVQVFAADEIGRLRFGSLAFRLAANGTLVFLPAGFDVKRVVSVARDGEERALPLAPAAYTNPRLSPDGRRLLLERDVSVEEILDLTRGTSTQLAPAAFGTSFSSWTSDGARVVFRRFNLPFWAATDGSGRSGSLAGGELNDYPSGPGPDPDTVLLVRIRPETAGDLFLASVTGAFPPKVLLATPAYEGGPELSPDWRWLIYQSNESGQPEIYVRRYPELDRAWQVSEGGGVQTRWSADGREIYYRNGHDLMAAAFDGRGAEPVLGRPRALFPDEFDFGLGLSVANYDVGRDGRFLMLRRTGSGGRLKVVLRWTAELERLVAAAAAR